MSIYEIYIFISFANFYEHFIQGFSRIPTTFTLILKITELLDSILRIVRIKDNIVVGNSSNRVDKTVKNLSKFKKLKNIKSKVYILIGAIIVFLNLTCNAKKTFNLLKQGFIKVKILQHFFSNILPRLKLI